MVESHSGDDLSTQLPWAVLAPGVAILEDDPQSHSIKIVSLFIGNNNAQSLAIDDPNLVVRDQARGNECIVRFAKSTEIELSHRSHCFGELNTGWRECSW